MKTEKAQKRIGQLESHSGGQWRTDTFDTKVSLFLLVHDVGLAVESDMRGRFLQGLTSVGFPQFTVACVQAVDAAART